MPSTYPVPLNLHTAPWQDQGADIPTATALLRDLPRRAEWARMVLHALGVEVERVVVACDPSGSERVTSDEVGIVVVACGRCRCKGGEAERHAFVLDDLTGSYTPAEWGALLVGAYAAFRADRIVAEINYGGALVEANLRSAEGGANLPYTGVHARQGKALRAEPVSALTEQGKDHHVGTFAKLEDELTQWDPRDLTAKSPNRLDAKVYGETELMVEGGAATFAGLPSSMKWRR